MVDALAQALQQRDEARCVLQGALERLETLEATRADAALHVSMLQADNRQLQLQLQELRQGGSREQGAGQLAAVEAKVRGSPCVYACHGQTCCGRTWVRILGHVSTRW